MTIRGLFEETYGGGYRSVSILCKLSEPVFSRAQPATKLLCSMATLRWSDYHTRAYFLYSCFFAL